MLRLRPIAILLALLACTGLVAACGQDQSVDEVLAETFGEEKEIRSGRLDVNLRVDVQGLPNLRGPIGVRLAGPFQSTGNAELPRFDFTFGLDGAGQALQAGAVSTGDKGFVRFAGESYAMGDDVFRQFREGYAEQARCSEGREQGLSLRTLGIDPRRWLRDAEDAGSEEVGGVATTHIRARVDVPRFLEDVNRIISRAGAAGAAGQADPCDRDGQEGRPRRPAGGQQLSEAERREIGRSVRDARIQVWSGEEDRTLRRLNVELRLQVPEENRGRAGGLQSGVVRFDLALGELNEDQEIRAPEGARPLEQLSERFGGRLPGIGGGGASGGAGSGTAPAQPEQPAAGSTGGASPEYLQCVQEAGQDADALQRCAELAGR